MKPSRWRLGAFLLGAALIAGPGCASSPPSKFYTLSPMPISGEAKMGKETAGKPLAVLLGPVHLPYYLARKEIVTRTDTYRIDLAENEFWGGSLQDDFSRTLLENLSFLLAEDRINLSPWPGGGRGDYRVAVDVLRFDGSRGGEIVLLAKWIIRNGQDNKEVRSRDSRIRETVNEQSYEGLVAGMSKAVARLSQEIGEDLKTLSR